MVHTFIKFIFLVVLLNLIVLISCIYKTLGDGQNQALAHPLFYKEIF